MALYIQFREAQEAGRRTMSWVVETKDPTMMLGRIRWYSAWRCYVYQPLTDTVYERQCLRDLAQFCEEQTARVMHK